jgi:hemoglobin/transferrin/lactoferrin receptor protein
MAGKTTVLLVDDDAEFVEATRNVLESDGYEVLHAPNGAEGLAMARQFKPALTILDVMMTTDTEGIEVSRLFKDTPELEAMPVILLTGMRDAVGLPAGLEPDTAWLPVHAVLEKPVPPTTLLAVVKETIAATRPPGEKTQAMTRRPPAPRRRLPVSVAVSSLLAGLACAATAAGETAPTQTVRVVELAPVVVTARGRETPLAATPGRVERLDAAEIARIGGVGVADLVARFPGVAAEADGAWGKDVNLRGLGRDSVVLLLDGNRVNTFNDLGARFGYVDPLAIERIEVLHGPISALYGSGSIGGVVNVLTRAGRFATPPAWHGGLAAGYESVADGLNAYGFAQYDAPAAHAFASQSWRNHAAYEDGRGDEVRNSQFQDAHTTLKIGAAPATAWRVEAAGQYSEGRDIGIPGSGTAPLPAAADVTYPHTSSELGMLTATFAPAWAVLTESRLQLSVQRVERRVRIDRFPAASPVAEIRPRAEHRTVAANWRNTLVPAGGHLLAAGLDVWRWDMESTRLRLFRDGRRVTESPLPDASMVSAGLFAEDDWQLAPGWLLNAGGRLDAIRVENDANDRWAADGEGETGWNAHLGAAWGEPEGLAAKGVVAAGYRAASLSERFQYLELGGGKVKLGNPDLDPERSLLAECGAQWRTRSLALGLSVFHHWLGDLIGEVAEDALTIRNRNVDEATIYGAELDAAWRPGAGWRLYANAGSAVGDDTRNDEPLPGVAPLSGLLGAECDPAGPGAWGRLESRFAAAQERTPPGVEESPAWAIANLRLGWDLASRGRAHRVYAGVDNLFGATYRNYLSTTRGTPFNEPGRSFALGLQSQF